MGSDGLLEAPCNMAEFGQIDISEVAQTMFKPLSGVELDEIKKLEANRKIVGMSLAIAGVGPFHFRVDGDELHWGDGAALTCHDWLDGLVPRAMEPIALRRPLPPTFLPSAYTARLPNSG